MKESANTELSEILNQFPGMIFWTEDGGFQAFLDIKNVIDVTGYTASEINNLKYGWRSLIYSEDLHLHSKMLDEFEKNPNQNLLELEYRITRKDENIIHLSEKIQVIRDSDGNIIKRFGMITNVTNYKKELERRHLQFFG